MKALKQILTIVMALISIVTCVPTAVYAAPVTIVDSGKCGDNATWTLDSTGNLTISGKGDMWDVYSLPDRLTDEYEDFEFDDKIGNLGSFKNHLKDIKRVIVQEGITGIGAGAFADLYHLHNVSLAETVKEIGRNAFLDCGELREIKIPSRVKKISAYTFWLCNNLEKVELHDDITVIETYAFGYCRNLTIDSLPAKLQEIKSYALYGCNTNNIINLPNNIRVLEAGTLSGCGFSELVIPSTINKLEIGLLSGCKELETISISENVTTIEGGVFWGCDKLKEVLFPSSISSINTINLFNGCSSLKEIKLPECIEVIDAYAFKDCVSLEKLVIPENVNRIGEEAFYDCSSLQAIIIPDGVASIGKNAFNGCTCLTKIVIPKSVTDIYDNSIGYGKYRYVYTKEMFTQVYEPGNGKLTIYGYKGSEAENYAKNNNIPFKYLFTDIDALSSGSKKSIQWADEAGIVKGYDDGTFRPDEICTRAQMVVMLWRLAGRINPASMNSAKKFSDVANLSAGVQKAIAWAVENGIIKGYADGTFRPGEKVTRQQTMIMLWRLAGKPEPEQAATVFTDMGSVSSGIKKAVYWGCETGITKGTRQADGTYKFNPQDGCKRQHSATFIFRYARLAGILSAD